MNAWHDFFSAGAGAAAALAGLLTVALSVNLTAILAIPGVPARAAATLATTGLCLATGITALIPDLPPWTLAAQTGTCAALALVLHLRALRLTLGTRRLSTGHVISRILEGPAAVSPFLVAAVLLPETAPVGLALIAAGTVLGLLATLENGWVLLIEILR